MEKLQAALDKARRARGQEPVAGPRTRAIAAEKPQHPGGIDPLWDALTPFDPPKGTLKSKLVVTREASEDATPFDILRTKVLLQMRQNNWTRLAITSPMPSSGKTTTACNLALGLGRQKELRTMLFDLDLRDPSIGEFFSHKPAQSIGDVLTQSTSYAQQALRIGDNLAVSMANRMESDPTRILLAEQTVEVLADIEKTYKPDVMIFDLPSVLKNDDSRAFLKNVDCALIISRANKTRYGEFDACEREIAEHTNVLGVVLNASRHRQLGNE